MPGGADDARDQVEAAGYFLVSEALKNAAKHAHATVVRVTVSRQGHCLVIEVADDGTGGATAGGGSGLLGLADRVERLGGRLTVSSTPGRGTTLRADLPCEEGWITRLLVRLEAMAA